MAVPFKAEMDFGAGIACCATVNAGDGGAAGIDFLQPVFIDFIELFISLADVLVMLFRLLIALVLPGLVYAGSADPARLAGDQSLFSQDAH